jgi:hypothetical protein
MVRRIATAALMVVFVGSVLCAIVCPGETYAATNHVCTKTDHSCCPKSHDQSEKDQCVDTHFVGMSKFHHGPLNLTALAVGGIDGPVLSDLSIRENVVFYSFSLPPEDLLSKHHALRI